MSVFFSCRCVGPVPADSIVPRGCDRLECTARLREVVLYRTMSADLTVPGLSADELDKRFVQLRNGCRDERLDRGSRVRLLELVELRAQQTPWTCNENVTSYYRQMLQLIEVGDCCRQHYGSEVAAVAAEF